MKASLVGPTKKITAPVISRRFTINHMFSLMSRPFWVPWPMSILIPMIVSRRKNVRGMPLIEPRLRVGFPWELFAKFGIWCKGKHLQSLVTNYNFIETELFSCWQNSGNFQYLSPTALLPHRPIQNTIANSIEKYRRANRTTCKYKPTNWPIANEIAKDTAPWYWSNKCSGQRPSPSLLFRLFGFVDWHWRGS